MKKTITLLVTVAFSLYIFSFDYVSVYAQNPKITVGMLVLEAKGGLTEQEVAVISDRLQEHLVQTGAFDIVERGKVNEILKEQGFQQTGTCSMTECVVEIGKIIGAQQMVAGSIGKVGKRFAFSVRLFDVETSRILKAVSKDYDGPIEDLLSKVTKEVATELAGSQPTTKAGKGGKGKGWVWAIMGGVLATGGGLAAVILSGKKASQSTGVPNPPDHPSAPQ